MSGVFLANYCGPLLAAPEVRLCYGPRIHPKLHSDTVALEFHHIFSKILTLTSIKIRLIALAAGLVVLGLKRVRHIAVKKLRIKCLWRVSVPF